MVHGTISSVMQIFDELHWGMLDEAAKKHFVVVYSAKVTPCDEDEVPIPDPPVETYGGATFQFFKKRWYGHNGDMNNPNKRHATTLSNHVWDLKDQNINYKIKWKILAFCRFSLHQFWGTAFPHLIRCIYLFPLTTQCIAATFERNAYYNSHSQHIPSVYRKYTIECRFQM